MESGWNRTSPGLAVRAQCGDQERQTKYDKYEADDEGGPQARFREGVDRLPVVAYAEELGPWAQESCPP